MAERTWFSPESAPLDEEVLATDGETIAPAMLLSIGWAKSADGHYLWEGGSFGFPAPLGFVPTGWARP